MILAQTLDLQFKTIEAEEATEKAHSATREALRLKAHAETAKLESEELRAQAERHAGELEVLDQQNVSRDAGMKALLASMKGQKELAAQKANLLTQFESGYPRVEALTNEIAELDRSIADALGTGQADLRRNLMQAQQREQALQAQI